MSLLVGLTGGIGSGKTTVCDLFAKHGIDILDADIIAREVVQPGKPALTEIRNLFGNTVVNAHGELIREKLRELIFTDENKRRALENLLHPMISEEMHRRALASHSPYCIVCVPLLLESKLFTWVDRLLVVDTSEALQITRVMQRDKVNEDDAKKILQAQISREERLKVADDIIINDSDLGKLYTQVEALHNQYLDITSSSNSK